MRCLLVEDEVPRIEAALPQLRAIFGQVDVARDKVSAFASVEGSPYDLVVLDQKIPSELSQLDAAVEHGRAVYGYIREVAPDTPIYFLTGLEMEAAYVDRLIEEGDRRDIFGTGSPMALTRRFSKAEMAPFYARASEIAALAKGTDSIELNSQGANFNLSVDNTRILKAFTRLKQGVCLDLTGATPGLSGAMVLRGIIKDANGGPRFSAICKLGKDDRIAIEIDRFGAEISRLKPGTYAPLIPVDIGRSRRTQGAFYRLLEDHDRSFFSLLAQSDVEAAACVSKVRASQEPWLQNAIGRKLPIAELAKILIWEDRIDGIHSIFPDFDWTGIESQEINVRFCTRHGDLHGENILVDRDGNPMMIDFGSVGELPSAIDAVTLELSTFFHPEGVEGYLNWKSGDGAIDWFDRTKFGGITKIPNVVTAAREWAHQEAFGEKEVLACAYVYVLRQLQFDTANRELAYAFLQGLAARMANH